MYRLRLFHGVRNATAILSICALAFAMRASAQTFTSSDGAYSFKYPQRWQASDSNAAGGTRIVAPDGSSYSLKIDTIESLPSGSPVNDTGLKQSASKLAEPIASGARFVKASSVSMDHGQGAAFRYKTGSGDTLDVWIGIIGKHSVVLVPSKAGLPGQTIGLSVIFQTMSFVDALPKQPARPTPPPARMDTTQGAGSATTAHTVLFSKQIAPVLSQRCLACHSRQSASGGLDVSSYSSFVAGGARGRIIKPGNAAGSSLIDYLTGARDQMPKGSDPLSAAQIDLFRTWIREGASNDLDPAATVASAAGASQIAGAAGPGQRLRNGANLPASSITRRAAAGPKAMESYDGHLATNDSSFELRLYTNQTATAKWTFEQPSPARFEGTFTTTSGVYTIQMNLVSGSIPGGSRSLKLVMQATGTDVVGKFSLDGTSPKYKIIGLQLAEIDNATKNPGGGASAAASRGRGKR